MYLLDSVVNTGTVLGCVHISIIPLNILSYLHVLAYHTGD